MTRAAAGLRSSLKFAGVVDIGSFKTVCLIARVDAAGNPRIAGVGHVPSRGVKSGTIIDLAAAEHGVRSAIADAERMAGVRLSEIDVSVSCGRLASCAFQASTDVASGAVEDEHLAKLHNSGRRWAERNGRRLLLLSTFGYRLDGTAATREPLGMAASRISADFHVVTADAPPIGNLIHVIERCYLQPGAVLPAPLASAITVTSQEEREAGVTAIDIGGGVTGVASFLDGRPIYADAVAIGGQQITLDIAHALRTPLEEAERIKTVYGTVINAQSNLHDVFSYPVTGYEEGEMHRTTKADLARIIQSRVAALLVLVRDRLAEAGLAQGPSRRIVLTGGSSQIPGLVSLAEGIFRCRVRDGRPRHVSGLPPLLSSAAFAGVVGLLEARTESSLLTLPDNQDGQQPLGYASRVGRWLRDGF